MNASQPLHLVVLTEEPSFQAFLEQALEPRLPEGVVLRILVFEGWTDLHRRLKRRIRGWRQPNSLFLVTRDQDQRDCRELKETLRSLCPEEQLERIRVRILCRELESWFVGNLSAVDRAFGTHLIETHGGTAPFRDPDAMVKPSERLRTLTEERYQKISGSREIGRYFSWTSTRSRSCQVFARLVEDLLHQQGHPDFRLNGGEEVS